MLKRLLRRVRGRGARQVAQQQPAGLPKRAHGWQKVRLIDGFGENGEILRLEICIGCNAKRCTAYRSDGQIVMIATEPEPLPPFCAKRLDNSGSDLQT